MSPDSTDSVDDLDTFIDALCFNWLIGGTDTPASQRPRGATCVILRCCSIIPYDDVDLQKMKLAMKIGREYKLGQLGAREWQKFAREIRFEAETMIAGLSFLADLLPDNVTCALPRKRKG
ncbi:MULTISPECIES: hypothetical protein [unclassified Bradyrhizobium]|uniref:hypothetical protein n=1 Tax=unclassified Bradyrhizobium TaxID=2631580 RepID=UPI002012C21E|nr:MULTISPECIES: hypothetical protein [unclassified Bradyrhizobium]